MKRILNKLTCCSNTINPDSGCREIILTTETSKPPAGQLALQLNNSSDANFFKIGSSYYLDFTPAKEVDEDTAIWQPITQLPKPGVDLIKEFEGCYLTAYPDPLTKGKPYTIGWGSTRKLNGEPWNLGETITQEEADDLLTHQLETHYLPSLQKIPVWPDLNENQRGALLSFAYNLGANFYGSTGFNTITGVLRMKRWNEIEKAFLLYCNPGSRVEAGLRRRRRAEARLFLS